MRVFVIGLIDKLNPEKKEVCKIACRELGREIADRNYELIVASENPITADPYIVEGLLNSKEIKKLTVYRPDDPKIPYSNQEFNKISIQRKRGKGPYESVHLQCLLESDCLIIIGGRDLTEKTAYIADTLDIPVIPIPLFEGTGKEFFSNYYEHKRFNDLKINNHELSDFRERWSETSAKSIINIAEKACKFFTKKKKKKKFWPILILFFALMLIGSWVWLFTDSNPLGSNIVTLFILLSLCSFLGVLLRRSANIMQGSNSDNILHELGAGLILSFAFGLFYFVGDIIFTGEFNPKIEIEDFNRVSITLSLLGIGSSFLLEKSVLKFIEKYNGLF